MPAPPAHIAQIPRFGALGRLGFRLYHRLGLGYEFGLRWRRTDGGGASRGGHGGAYTAVVGGHGLVHRLGHVVPDMPAVGDLGGLGCALAGAFGVGAGPVPADDLRTRAVAQPRG
jgi:hypothetical protein